MSPTIGKTGAARLNSVGRLMLVPSVGALLTWMVIPLAITIWLSFQDYRLLDADQRHFAGLANYRGLFADPAFAGAILNTLLLILFVLAATIFGGILIALLVEAARIGRSLLRVLIISPFFVMPGVSALLWKNLLMQPISGLLGWLGGLIGLAPFDWFARQPLLSVSIIVAWEWLPFAALVFLTALQSFDAEQKEAAQLDGASGLSMFRYLTLPHLARSITIVIMMETIFLLSIFAEIFVTTGGGPGTATTNVAYLIYTRALLQYDVGAASAAGVVAVVIANVIAFLFARAVGRSLDS
ncbi:carbohydrate ABC transporter permease [Sphingomonas crusticola]|uniref:carbohydrate ABC transporter permease n=1 Tax=Sphingomonas crusticola TaxID=1697973 RepID=UPI000E222843|nr:sugar ABC transporter permease [Sphingomonas crusticola]